MVRKVLVVTSAALAAACGGRGGGTPLPTPTTAAIEVAGSYEIRKSIAEDGCGLGGAGEVLTNPATVRHSRGAAEFVLDDHGTRDLPGSVGAGGAFELRGAASVVMGTIAATDTFEGGRFTATGFTVRDMTVLQRRPPAGAPDVPCRVVANWAATKLGAPNVIP
jgi:hypothetical protein